MLTAYQARIKLAVGLAANLKGQALAEFIAK